MPGEQSNILTRMLLIAGITMPIIYFAALFIAGVLYPDYSHIRQLPSELGADGAPYEFAFAFNLALIIVGLCGLAG